MSGFYPSPEPVQLRHEAHGDRPDIEIVQDSIKLPYLECLSLQLGDRTKDAYDVSRVSDFNRFLTFLHVDLGQAREGRNHRGHHHACGYPRQQGQYFSLRTHSPTL